MGQRFSDLMRYVERMGSSEWLIVAFIGIVIGFFCLRGYGSRSNY